MRKCLPNCLFAYLTIYALDVTSVFYPLTSDVHLLLNCTQVVNMMKFQQAVYRYRVNKLFVYDHGRWKNTSNIGQLKNRMPLAPF